MSDLVTGAAGFIGFQFFKSLLAKGDIGVGIDDVNDYYIVALHPIQIGNF